MSYSAMVMEIFRLSVSWMVAAAPSMALPTVAFTAVTLPEVSAFRVHFSSWDCSSSSSSLSPALL